MQIKIAKFEGPLDLLLRLIEEQKLEITTISLAEVTGQFLQYMRTQSHLAPHELANWMAVAAKLLVIKSKALLPTLSLSAEEEQEATNLTWQLYQYKLHKEAAKYLRKLENRSFYGFSRHASFDEKITFYPDAGINTSVLRDCLRYLAKTLAEITAFPKKILEEVVSISEKIDHLQTVLAEKIELKLKDLLQAAKSKTEIIVTFLALLELVKQKILTTEQKAIFADITIKKINPS